MDVINIGLLGLGTVEAGTVNLLLRNVDEIARRTGRKIVVHSAFVSDLKKSRDCDTQSFQLTNCVNDIIHHAEIDIVIELLGGTDISRDLILAAITNGKHVVTANKALIALHGNEIFSAAEQQGVLIGYEAAVAGGIPIIKTIREGLSANLITSLTGILNGTANFILTVIREQHCEFETALAQARARGYAEANPSFDIDGIDMAHKLAILASIAFGVPLQFEQVYVEGIRQITLRDITYAEELGYRIKHLAFAQRVNNSLQLRVHPTLIPLGHSLAHVNGVVNAIMVEGDAVGSTMHIGEGAGSEPTASSVVADIIDIVRAHNTNLQSLIPSLAFQPEAIEALPITPMTGLEIAYYLSMTVRDEPGVLARITQILATHQVSIECLLQKEAMDQEGYLPVVILTHRTEEKAMQKIIKKLEEINEGERAVVCIRVEHLETVQ